MLKKWASRSFMTLMAALLALGCAAVLAEVLQGDDPVEALYDRNYHQYLVASQLTGLEDLKDQFLGDQLQFLFIAPPDPDFVLVQPGGIATILDLKAFPASFIERLVGVEEGALTTFPVWVYEDAESAGREVVVLNAEGEEIARIPREYGYCSEWFVREQYPDLGQYDAWYRDWLIGCFDPARVAMRYDLVVGEDELIRLVWQQSIQAAALAADEGGGGGMAMCGWDGGSVTNIEFVAIEKTNDATQVTIAYPDDFTNALDIFTCDTGLPDFWWEHGVTTNVDASTNWIAWTDPQSTNSYVDCRFYAAANADTDSDGDGFSDGFETYVYHTGVTNSNSYPVSVSGTISYTGSLSGPVRMIAVTTSNSWVGCMASIPSPGDYTNAAVANGTSYWFKAYRDCDYSKTKEYGEPWGVYSNTSTLVTNDLTGIDIAMSDHDEDGDGLIDWWEMQYFGDLSEGAGGDPDEDNLVNSNEYAQATDPTDPDTDDDGLTDGDEVNVWSTDPTDTDSDDDGLSDGSEIDAGTDPMNPDTTSPSVVIRFPSDNCSIIWQP